ncbi:hypothetical protein [Rahnella aceris]|uniref:Uncharacterized protein n=1 Tax=Rahnella sp. (strain Y9602) TaxID=2703885 RepID=A0ABW6CJX3_RAHSY
MAKQHAYVEHRPATTTTREHHVVIVDGKVEKITNTQKEAADWANNKGYATHVARERHLQDRDIPDHWRVYP